MSKSFSPAERAAIRDTLIDRGRELFSRYGLRKTTIDDLAGGAGISKGAFYGFFRSKEELFVEIHEHDMQIVRAEAMARFFPDGRLTRERFRAFLLHLSESFHSNPLLMHLFQEGEMAYLARRLPHDKIEAHQRAQQQWLLPHIEGWCARGALVGRNPQAILAVIRSLFLLPLMRSRMREELYRETIALWVDVVTEGLVREEE